MQDLIAHPVAIAALWTLVPLFALFVVCWVAFDLVPTVREERRIRRAVAKAVAEAQQGA